jgi:hypothetical protein
MTAAPGFFKHALKRAGTTKWLAHVLCAYDSPIRLRKILLRTRGRRHERGSLWAAIQGNPALPPNRAVRAGHRGNLEMAAGLSCRFAEGRRLPW